MQRLRVVLELIDVAPAGDAPAERRLARVLKSLLRRWNFRCIRAVHAEPGHLFIDTPADAGHDGESGHSRFE